MKYYSTGVRTTNGTTTQACLEIIAGASIGFRLVGIFGISLAAATASSFGLGRPAAKGVTPTTPLTLAGNDKGLDSKATTALAWGTSPTAPAKFYHRTNFTNVVGSDQAWPLSVGGIWVPPNETIVVWNITATGVSDISFTIWE